MMNEDDGLINLVKVSFPFLFPPSWIYLLATALVEYGI